MTNEWKQVFEGIELPGIDIGITTHLPQELIDRLDLVYFSNAEFYKTTPATTIDLEVSREEVGGIPITVRKILEPFGNSMLRNYLKVIVGSDPEPPFNSERTIVMREIQGEDDTLDNLYIFGAVFGSPGREGYAATPIFSVGEPVREGNSYVGLYPKRSLEGNLKLVPGEWGAKIGVDESGKGSVYFGQRVDAEAVVFPEPLKYDHRKSLYLVRSPNGSLDFESLGIVEQSEGRDNKVEYNLVYDNLNNLRRVEGRTWAFNSIKRGLTWEANVHLFVEAREK